MSKLVFSVGTLVFLLSASAAARAADQEPAADPRAAGGGEAAPPAEDKPRESRVEVGVTLVPWGMAYTRAGFGLSATYKLTPLVRAPGILWESTNVTVGVRDFFGFVNNTLGAFVEITPIAFFKLQVYAGYDSLFVDPFAGGVRVLTPLGEQQLGNGAVGRNQAGAVDWVGGTDNREIFLAPVNGGGLRLQVLPTLQAAFGPVAMRYTFMADWNFYRAGDHGSGAVFHDTLTFTLRKLHDFEQVHEALIAYDIPVVPAELLLGAGGRYLKVAGTGLDSLGVNALVYCRPDWRAFNERLSFWGAGQFGTNVIDPMHQYAFAWVLALGADVRLF